MDKYIIFVCMSNPSGLMVLQEFYTNEVSNKAVMACKSLFLSGLEDSDTCKGVNAYILNVGKAFEEFVPRDADLIKKKMSEMAD